jgi:propanediol dehydratase small subunit
MDNIQNEVKALFNSVSVKEAATDFALAEVKADASVKTIAGEMGIKPTFTLWNLVSADFKAAYQVARKCDIVAADKAWQRMTARMASAYGLNKPAAEKKESKAKALVRDKQAKQVKAAVAKHKTVAALQRQAGQALEAGKPADADVFMKAAKVAKVADEKAVKVAQATRWDKVADAVKAAKAAHDERILAAIEKAISTLVPVKAGKKSK